MSQDNSQQQQQQQQAPQKPAKGTPEYNQMMVELYEKQFGAPDPNAQAFKLTKPANVPDKFWNAETGVVDYEAWSKSYSELETKFTQSSQQKPANGDGKPATDQDPAKQAVQDAGLNWEEIQTQVRTSGTLRDEDFAALEKAGIPRPIVEDYVNAQRVAAEALKERTARFIGNGDPVVGEQRLKHTLEWASKNLSQQEREVFNRDLAGEGWQAALQILAQRAGAMSEEPTMRYGNGTGNGTAAAFASLHEQTEAINDPRYRTDPAYRSLVRQRIALSKF